MTTIAYARGCMAGDGRVTRGNTVVTDSARKVHMLSDGSMVGFCGDADLRTVLNLIEFSLRTDSFPPPTGEIEALGIDFEALVVERSGRRSILSCSVTNNVATACWHTVGELFCAIGTGDDAAWGALFMGATAAEAVEAAKQRDALTGGALTVLYFGGHEETKP